MIALTHEELEETLRALDCRQRANGVGTRQHQVCNSVLAKLAASRDSERRRLAAVGQPAAGPTLIGQSVNGV